MKHRIIAVFIGSLVLSTGLMAQERDFMQEFEAFEKGINRQYEDFVEKANREFADFLAKAWEQFPTEEPVAMQERPEPVDPVIYEEPTEKEKEPDTPAEKAVDVVPERVINRPPFSEPPKPKLPQSSALPSHIKVPVVPVVPIIDDTKKEEEAANEEEQKEPDGLRIPVHFFGTEVWIAAKCMAGYQLNRIEERDVSNAWKDFCKVDYAQTVQDCMDIREELRLNDWAYTELIKQLALTLYGSQQPNEMAFLQMFLLLQSGYKVKIAKIGEQLTLMYATSGTVYGAPSVIIDQTRYYICEPLGERASKGVFTYKSEFANAKSLVDLQIFKPIRLAMKPIEKSWSVPHSDFTLTSTVNENLISFYAIYPQCDVELYANAAPSDELKAAILPALRAEIKEKSREEAVSFLLTFIQKAFAYQTDGQQFGYEKPFFADETFYYPYCDCEDRSILFAYLVKELTGLDAVLLNYPKHIAAAVCFNKEMEGDHLLIEGRRYTICDPTFIGASIGACMPQYKGVSPVVIRR